MLNKKPHTTYLFYALTWMLIFYLYYFFSFFGLTDWVNDEFIYDYLTSWKPHLELFLTGTIFGCLFALTNSITENTKLRRRSLGQIIVIKSIFYLMALVIISLVIYIVFFGFGLMRIEDLDNLLQLYSFKYTISLALFLIISTILVNIAAQVREKFGPGNFIKLLFGKYRNPKEENKIFMFLDLRGSTSIAEKLGHKKYSKFIRQCYHELTEFVIQFRAEIYQYVGDEVVLCWNSNEGIKDMKCIKLYYAFSNRLLENKHIYLSEYGVAPVFKCGIDMGKVTATEIGDLKREIAYHGDVLNTASRIQELCNNFGREILISEHVVNNTNEELETKFVTDMALRGKSGTMKIYTPVLKEKFNELFL